MLEELTKTNVRSNRFKSTNSADFCNTSDVGSQN